MNVRDRPPSQDGIPATNRKPSWGICCRLADNLKKYRLLRGYTQADLAVRCGFHKNYVGNVEQARVNITLANLETLAGGLGCGEEELLMRNR
jgi:transcriptional regulator with XRE-family HTH domain